MGQLELGNNFYKKNIDGHNGTNCKNLNAFIRIKLNSPQNKASNSLLHHIFFVKTHT
ncbi:hypothetical protein DOY81_003171, partial [Sarcophaga bullata]